MLKVKTPRAQLMLNLPDSGIWILSSDQRRILSRRQTLILLPDRDLNVSDLRTLTQIDAQHPRALRCFYLSQADGAALFLTLLRAMLPNCV